MVSKTLSNGKTIAFDDRLHRALMEIKERNQKKDKHYILIVDGDLGCVSGDTIIRCNRASLGKKFTIRWMFNQLHGNPQQLRYLKPWNLSIQSYVRSYDNNLIRLHKIRDVVYSGKRFVKKLILEDGKEIKLTPDHKVMTQEGWVRLDNLDLNKHLIMIDIPKSQKKYSTLYKVRDACIYGIKNHPYARKSNSLPAHRLIYEAKLNNLKLEDFLNIIINQTEDFKNLKFIDSSIFDIHHIDGNHYNNSPDNLTILTKEEHSKEHAKSSYLNFNQGMPAFVKIKSITDVGEEDTYDIICEDPYHNFSANDIIVHNSGKSTLSQQVSSQVDNYFCDDTSTKIHNTVEQFVEAIIKCKKYGAHILDEGLNGANARRAMSSLNILLQSVLTEIRQKNLFLVVCVPFIFDLDRSLALGLSDGLIHCYEKGDDKRYFKFYGKRAKKALYLNPNNKKYYMYKGRCTFYGRFSTGYVMDEKEYRKFKEKSLQKFLPKDIGGSLDSPEDLVKKREAEIYTILEKNGITPYRLSQMGVTSKATAYKRIKSQSGVLASSILNISEQQANQNNSVKE